MDPREIDLGPERDRRSIVALVADGTIDTRVAALAWILLEHRTSLLVAAGPSGTGKTVLLRALLGFLPPDAAVRTVAGIRETFAWLPRDVRGEVGLGAPSSAAGGAAAPGATAPGATAPGTGGRADTAPGADRPNARPFLVVPEISPHLPLYAWDRVAHTAIRLASLGYPLLGTTHAESLREVFDVLGGPGVGATPDELAGLGLVLVVRAVDERRDRPARRRVVAAHYVRPLSRDGHGHVQRLDPAVLATWSPGSDSFDDFSWGVLPEIAARLSMTPAELESERDRRAAYLEALAAAGVVGEDAAIAAIRSDSRPPARA